MNCDKQSVTAWIQCALIRWSYTKFRYKIVNFAKFENYWKCSICSLLHRIPRFFPSNCAQKWRKCHFYRVTTKFTHSNSLSNHCLHQKTSLNSGYFKNNLCTTPPPSVDSCIANCWPFLPSTKMNICIFFSLKIDIM